MIFNYGESMKFLILGGDERCYTLHNILLEEGYEIVTYGFDKKEDNKSINYNSLKKAIINSEIIICPTPFTKDQNIIFSPFSTIEIPIWEVVEKLNEKHILVGGKIPKTVINQLKSKDVKVFDILDREDFAILNAIPTAEGALGIAMSELDRTIHDSNVLVLGYGRIGKVLSSILKAFGANVFIEARKIKDLVWIDTFSYKSIHINNLVNYVSKMDIIFNTIPSLVIDEDLLRFIKKDAIIIDLASKPGGVDFDKAEEFGIKTIWALSLPGKVAPISSAEYIKKTLFSILEEEGVEL